eukprot:gene19788-65592_t
MEVILENPRLEFGSGWAGAGGIEAPTLGELAVAHVAVLNEDIFPNQLPIEDHHLKATLVYHFVLHHWA